MIKYWCRMLAWSFVLHWKRWSMYRADVVMWILTIWATLIIQGVVLYSISQVTGGSVFGYAPRQLLLFFGVAILSTGMAQSFVQGLVFRLGHAVNSGQFDSWLLHPVPLLMRMFLEDMGFVWFWPHLAVGTGIIFWTTDFSTAILAIGCCAVAAVMESGFMIALSSFAIRWSAWNPESFLWEYLEQARSVPVIRSGSNALIVASLGVLQYSIAMEVISGGLSIFTFIIATSGMVLVAFLCMQLNVRYYSSASG